MRAITANRLADGEVVFWKHGAWVERFAQAEIFDDDATAEAEIPKAIQPTVVVEPYVIDLIKDEAGLAPVSYRERIRCLGPTNHPQHGKQAEGDQSEVAALVGAHGAARSVGRVNLIKRK
ncbi:MAG TPA: DUF2849 domain-containing protein [Caulobacteraceae bacterium]|nr:DUF2849 domain-containing protein [Caulobacteraceae bacterium]